MSDYDDEEDYYARDHFDAPTAKSISEAKRNQAGEVAPSLRVLPRESAIVNETSAFDTMDREDHTFSGIMFNVNVDNCYPLKFCRLDSVSVRGGLGPMKIFVTKFAKRFEETFSGNRCDPSEWQLVYDKEHEPCIGRVGRSVERTYAELKLDEPVIIEPNQTFGIYVHSGREDDEGIVYDNSSAAHQKINSTGTLKVLPRAFAHLNSEPFNSHSPWGYGNGWRQNREFVGKVSFGVKWLLWSPEIHNKFPKEFKNVVELVLLAWHRDSSPVSWLPQEIIFYILNTIKWDSYGKPEIEEKTIPDDEEQVPRPFRHHPPPFVMQFLHGLGFWENRDEDDEIMYVHEQDDDDDEDFVYNSNDDDDDGEDGDDDEEE